MSNVLAFSSNAAPFVKQRVAICIIADHSPDQLERCLTSLRRVRLPHDVFPFVVIVDSSQHANAQSTFEACARVSAFPIYYSTEPLIAHRSEALNWAMDYAYEHGADWVAFIGDDCVADRDWLNGLMAYSYRNAPILVGNYFQLTGGPVPLPRNAPKLPDEGAPLLAAPINNIRLSMEVVREQRLRFPCEGDRQFLSNARKLGIENKYTERATVYGKAYPLIALRTFTGEPQWFQNCRQSLSWLSTKLLTPSRTLWHRLARRRSNWTSYGS